MLFFPPHSNIARLERKKKNIIYDPDGAHTILTCCKIERKRIVVGKASQMPQSAQSIREESKRSSVDGVCGEMMSCLKVGVLFFGIFNIILNFFVKKFLRKFKKKL